MGSILGLFILAGLWTPAVGALVAVVEGWIAFAGLTGLPGLTSVTSSNDQSVSMLLAVLGGTLAMIGPGAWSIDARLFGRKHIVV
jgi:putative oxidoreductase